MTPDGGFHWAPLCPPLSGVLFDAVAVRADGSILLGGDDGKLYTPTPSSSSCTGYSVVHTAPGAIHAILVAQNGDLYVGAKGGVLVCDPNCNTISPLASEVVDGLCESADGIEAVGDDLSNDQGFAQLRQGGTTWNAIEGTPNNRNRACFASPTHSNVYGAADGGLWKDTSTSSPTEEPMSSAAAGLVYTAIGGTPEVKLPLAAISASGAIVELDGGVWTLSFELGPDAGEGRSVVVLDGGQEIIAAAEWRLAYRKQTGAAFELATPPPIHLRALTTWKRDLYAVGDDGAGNGVLYHQVP